ncbi:Dmxl2 [Symbiodinium necroappetens]|uniref:Dmxl2 protein n=1 Tax=Symbiodinium necroappetens TaxID=1628268 RepID=A0A812L1M9_9DINO|nr:Dmxl2 [Symbiodinium necroappetens]
MCSGGKRVPEAEGQGQARGEGATAMVDALADITGTGTPSSGAMSSPASWLPDRGSLSRLLASPVNVPKGCGCGGLLSLGDWLRSLCEPWPEDEEPGHARLQRLHEKRLREQAAERALAEARKLAEEQEAREWQEELKVLETKRLRLQGEELEKDCLSYFASAEILLKEDVQERSPVTVEEVQPEASVGQRNVTSKDPVESWFRGLLKEPAEPEDSEFNSFGESELQLGHGGALAKAVEAAAEEPQTVYFGGKVCSRDLSSASISVLLRETSEFRGAHLLVMVDGGARVIRFGTNIVARMCILEVQTLQELGRTLGHQYVARGAKAAGEETESFSEQLDQLLARSSRKSLDMVDVGDAESSKASKAEEAADWVKALMEVLEAVLPKLRKVSDALAASPDPGSERLCLALAASELGQKFRCLEESRPQGPATPVPRFFHQGPFLGPATADVLWGLVAQQKPLLLENWVLVPGSPFGWQMMRATGVGWWGSALDQIVTPQRPQSSLSTFDAGVWGRAPEEQEQVARKLAVDEAVFWSVVLGATAPKLRALCKTGLFKEGQGGQLWTLLSHERANEPAFLRKNAFRLLELHRFHLAAALFLLAGSCEEALQIISRHLKDLQLCVLVARDPKHREALQKVLQRTEAAAEDLWLMRLLAHHGGAEAMAAMEPAATASTASPASPATMPRAQLHQSFDGLRLSQTRLLPEVERRIRDCQLGLG